jgi:hypothetical protein
MPKKTAKAPMNQANVWIKNFIVNKNEFLLPHYFLCILMDAKLHLADQRPTQGM